MKNKSKERKVIINFFAFMERKFKVMIKIVRTDNGTIPLASFSKLTKDDGSSIVNATSNW